METLKRCQLIDNGQWEMEWNGQWNGLWNGQWTMDAMGNGMEWNGMGNGNGGSGCNYLNYRQQK